MRMVLSRASIGEEPNLLEQFMFALAEDSPFLKASYPNFDQWIINKVIPGIYLGERTVVIEKRANIVSGLLIVKHTRDERKLCTLRVRQHYESLGLGVRLFELAFDILGTDRPLLSVSEGVKPKFDKLFEHFGFSQEATYPGLYLPFVEELSFNGLLKSENRQNWKPVSNKINKSCARNRHGLHCVSNSQA